MNVSGRGPMSHDFMTHNETKVNNNVRHYMQQYFILYVRDIIKYLNAISVIYNLKLVILLPFKMRNSAHIVLC